MSKIQIGKKGWGVLFVAALLVSGYFFEVYKPYMRGDKIVSFAWTQITGPIKVTEVSNSKKVTSPTRVRVAKVSKLKKVTRSTPVRCVHVVQKDDTLYSISNQYGVHIELIRHKNNIPSNSLIKKGQRLTIPL